MHRWNWPTIFVFLLGMYRKRASVDYWFGMSCIGYDCWIQVGVSVTTKNDYVWMLLRLLLDTVLERAWRMQRISPVNEVTMAWKYAEANRNRFVGIEGDVYGTTAFLYQLIVRETRVLVSSLLRSSEVMLNHQYRFVCRIYQRTSRDPTSEAIAQRRSASKR